MPKSDYTSTDSQSVTLYGKKVDTSNEVYPVLTDNDGMLKVKASLCDGIVSERCVAVSQNRSLQVEEVTRMVGTAFDGDTLDENFWAATSVGTGSITISGEADLSTGTTTDSTITLTSVRKARFVVSMPMEFKAVASFYSAADDDNIRRIGAYDVNNGFFFQLDGSTFSVGVRSDKSGSPTDALINSGDFNGDVTAYTMDTAVHKMLIQYSGRTVDWVIDGALIHTKQCTHDDRPTNFTLPITAENLNDNGNITDNELHIFGASIIRLGKLTTNPTSYYHALNTTTGINLKLSSGALSGLVINNCENTAVLTLSDSITDTSSPIWVFTSGNKFVQPVSIDLKGLPFSTGLRLTIADAAASVTVIYE